MSVCSEAGTVEQVKPLLGSSLRYRRLVVAGYVVFDPVALARPSMRPAEIGLLSSILRRSHTMLEFGAGGSTTLALKLGVSRLVSVESDLCWIGRIRADEAAARAEEEGRLRLLHADIGEIGFFGGPAAQSRQASWACYPAAPWRYIGSPPLDIVLIDGRFRVACILQTVLRAGPETRIAIHDFWNRTNYHCVLPFLEERMRCETLGVFTVRRGYDSQSLQALMRHALDTPG